MKRRNETPQPANIPRRLFAVIRALAADRTDGMRLTDVGGATGLSPATTYRLMQQLVAEGVVERSAQGRRYRLSLEFFSLAAQAGGYTTLRDLCRPSLVRLSATLNDTLFLLVRSGFDAVCLDRCEGPFPIRSYTRDIGGRVPLGVGQGALVLLAFLPEAERDEVIRYNVPRMHDLGYFEEIYLRNEIDRARQLGHVATGDPGLIPGMAGVAVPVLDRRGLPVAALSVGTLVERLSDERLPHMLTLLKREAEALGSRVNPFDITLRQPGAVLAGHLSPSGQRQERSPRRGGK